MGKVKLALNELCKENNEKLTDFLMKQDEDEETGLHYAAHWEKQGIVKFLLDAFSEEKDKLIEYVMKQNKHNNTVLHIAVDHGHEEIVKLLLEIFSEKEKDKLIEYVKT